MLNFNLVMMLKKEKRNAKNSVQANLKIFCAVINISSLPNA